MLSVLILYMTGGTYSLKSTPNDRFYGKLFSAIFLISVKTLLTGSHRRNIFSYFASNKSIQHLVDYGDYGNAMNYFNLCFNIHFQEIFWHWKLHFPSTNINSNQSAIYKTISLTIILIHWMEEKKNIILFSVHFK